MKQWFPELLLTITIIIMVVLTLTVKLYSVHLLAPPRTHLAATGCDQAPTNPPSARALFLERYAEDWGVYCENSPISPYNPPIWQKLYSSYGGGSLECALASGSAAYSNVYCYHDMNSKPNAKSFILSFSFWIPATTCNNQGGESIIQALEFTFNKYYQSKRYEFALQYQNVWDGYGVNDEPSWHYWIPTADGISGSWTNLPNPIHQCLQGNSWHTFLFEGEINSSDQVVYKNFTLDGIANDLTTIAPQTAPASTFGEKLTISVQLDSNSHGDPYKLLLNKINFIAATKRWEVATQADDGTGGTSGAFSWAIKNAGIDEAITFQPSVTKINFTGSLNYHNLQVGALIYGRCSAKAEITIDGAGTGANSKGLVLNGNNLLYGVKVAKFSLQQLSIPLASGNNQLTCVSTSKL
ncbi:MAG: hypothetical protein HXX08_07945 [Chloroflexi bacterium]|uniref:Uncharacterized protein n=1 Tax=Candidatus Chlorohelix allophototropha TaxID=3003348 RepID=A0A8T7M309_9CHLR|nr:hypothetical protein [Chloroflexota bacterium]WJW67662.1 hypothetical protein OZ401_000934 [Chloroflexota bacterium L227-S17]